MSTWTASCDRVLFVLGRLLSDGVKDQLLVTIQKTFNYSRSQAQQIFLMVMECMKKRALVGRVARLCVIIIKPPCQRRFCITLIVIIIS